MNIFNAERSNYYKAKKRELTRQKAQSRIVQEDALFIRYYGMSAYIELFPEAKYMGVNWHRMVLDELQRLDRRQLAQELTGMSLAYAASQSKKAGRNFKRVLKDLNK